MTAAALTKEERKTVREFFLSKIKENDYYANVFRLAGIALTLRGSADTFVGLAGSEGFIDLWSVCDLDGYLDIEATEEQVMEIALPIAEGMKPDIKSPTFFEDAMHIFSGYEVDEEAIAFARKHPETSRESLLRFLRRADFSEGYEGGEEQDFNKAILLAPDLFKDHIEKDIENIAQFYLEANPIFPEDRIATVPADAKWLIELLNGQGVECVPP